MPPSKRREEKQRSKSNPPGDHNCNDVDSNNDGNGDCGDDYTLCWKHKHAHTYIHTQRQLAQAETVFSRMQLKLRLLKLTARAEQQQLQCQRQRDG